MDHFERECRRLVDGLVRDLSKVARSAVKEAFLAARGTARVSRREAKTRAKLAARERRQAARRARLEARVAKREARAQERAERERLREERRASASACAPKFARRASASVLSSAICASSAVGRPVAALSRERSAGWRRAQAEHALRAQAQDRRQHRTARAWRLAERTAAGISLFRRAPSKFPARLLRDRAAPRRFRRAHFRLRRHARRQHAALPSRVARGARGERCDLRLSRGTSS